MNYYQEQEKVTARNILRRAEITRLTQNLKSRLALATFKTQRGLENVGLDSIERFAEQQHLRGRTDVAAPALQTVASSKGYYNPKREFEGLQQGFTPSEPAGIASNAPANGNRKRARTFDTGAQANLSRPTSMAAPSHIPTSHSVPSHMDRGQQQQLQPMILLNSSPERYDIGAINGTTEPQTPPPQRKPVNDDANLLLFLATSPGRGSMSPRTPGRDINFNEYLHLFTPSPQVNRQVNLGNIDSARKKLTFE